MTRTETDHKKKIGEAPANVGVGEGATAAAVRESKSKEIK